ncbi:helix-turn-helix domain-containing protein [Dolosigranulum pigrum]|uniref:Helix-turn-helix transcriptional regulator n=1 Tax=Dolosigranulum pigrum TaxID=29394 RepID=A0A516GK93_9LACT|nr:helix-turn-helix transcriptional regulator [Dolosigranulum pigrum]QDO91942.1 helix-turn-helix transcriptional regulator [Dolosigranulum pigrum]
MFKLDSQKVVEALATYVEKNNTTLEQLAKQSGVSMDRLQAYQVGEMRGNRETIFDLMRLFETDWQPMSVLAATVDLERLNQKTLVEAREQLTADIAGTETVKIEFLLGAVDAQTDEETLRSVMVELPKMTEIIPEITAQVEQECLRFHQEHQQQLTVFELLELDIETIKAQCKELNYNYLMRQYIMTSNAKVGYFLQQLNQMADHYRTVHSMMVEQMMKGIFAYSFANNIEVEMDHEPRTERFAEMVEDYGRTFLDHLTVMLDFAVEAQIISQYQLK